MISLETTIVCLTVSESLLRGKGKDKAENRSSMWQPIKGREKDAV